MSGSQTGTEACSTEVNWRRVLTEVLTKVWAGNGETTERVSRVGFKPETLPPLKRPGEETEG